MEPKKIILCPNPDRDTGMKATKSAIAILRDMGFQTVVCSPFRDPKTDAFGDLAATERSCIWPSWRRCTRSPCWVSTWGDWAFWRSWRSAL